MGRPKLSPRRHLTIRMPEVVYAEMILLRPQMQDAQGYTKYGAVSDYINSLVVADLSKIKDKLRSAEYHSDLEGHDGTTNVS